jgi:uncharacterized protein YdeI (YjbR/CyaY-like superfamily)
MPTLDPRFDAYIAKAAPFAQPILRELRARMHQACPDLVETIKWRNLSFEYHGLLAGMAAFKAHLAFGFWKDELLRADTALAPTLVKVGRVTELAGLPTAAAFAKAVKKAMALNRDGAKVPRKKAGKRPPIAMPAAFAQALAAMPKAQRTFDAFPPGKQRDYLEWITEAKKEATRDQRIEQAVAWLAEGKSRHWKYESC